MPCRGRTAHEPLTKQGLEVVSASERAGFEPPTSK